MKRVFLFFRTHKTLILSIGFLFAFSITVAKATSPYSPGATLDPQCAPGSSNCTVASGALSTLFVSGVNASISSPTSLTATIAYGSGNYTAQGNILNYRVYAYKIISGTPTYSTSYATLSADLVDNDSSTHYSVDLSWPIVAGADGYKVIFGHGVNDNNYQTGSYTTTTNSLIDDGCGVVCFSGSLSITPVGSFSNTNVINGLSTIIGGSATVDDNLYVAGNITCGGTCGSESLWTTVTNGINYGLGGDVGIGTTTPTKTLSVNGDITAGDIYFNNIATVAHYLYGANSSESLQVSGTGGDSPWIFNNENGQGLAIVNSSIQTHSFTSQTNLSQINLFGIEGLSLDNSNANNYFLRLGNTAQTFSNNTGLSVYISAGQGGDTGAENGGNIKIDAGAAGATGSVGNILLSTVTGGNVGIGTATPGSLLTVNGSFNATGDNIVLGNGTGTNPHVDIIARGDQDGLRLYSLNNPNGDGSVNPPSIGFYRTISLPPFTLPRFEIIGHPADNSDSDGFLLSSPASSIKWIAGSADGRSSGLGQPSSAMNFYQQSFFTGGIVVGADTGANTPVVSSVLRSGRKAVTTTQDVDGGDFTIAAGGGSGGDLVGGNMFFQTPDAEAVNSGLVQPMTTKMTLLRNGDFGIANTSPTFLLDVGSSSITTGTAVAEFQNAGGTCDVTPSTTGGITCSSDMNLKKNITNLFDGSSWSFNTNITPANQSVFAKVLALNPVDYNWNVEQNTDPTHAGFIAQEVQQVFPDLVTKNPTTHLLSLDYTGLVPYTIEAIKEMNISIVSIDDLTKPNTWRDALENWLADDANGIKNIFSSQVTTPSLCVGTNEHKTCITQQQLDQLLQQSNTGNAGSTSSEGTVETQTPDVTSPAPQSDTQSPAVTDPSVTPPTNDMGN